MTEGVDWKWYFECDGLIELSDNNLASKWVKSRIIVIPITIEEFVIFVIN